MRMELPAGFSENMKNLLRDEYADYLESLSGKPARGLRVNTGKIPVKEFLKISPFPLETVPWAENGFYIGEDVPVTAHPYFYAGLYYVQEPSAMLPAALLDVRPGDKVLDLCAAPGGKATEIGSRLCGRGLLIANDLSSSRAKALLKNLELHGIGNAMVCCEQPRKLLERYESFFDRVLVDAPCSGEGMFRRDPSMLKSYAERGPSHYTPVQREIADCAVHMLKPGGRMVYSTCTFSDDENEKILAWLLEKHPSMHLVPVACKEWAQTRSDILPGCVRLYPHRVRGEGHFAAVLEKDAIIRETPARTRAGKPDGMVCGEALRPWQEFVRDHLRRDLDGFYMIRLEDRLYAIPDGSERKRGIRYLRTGLYLGDCKKHGFEPSQALAMYLRPDDAVSTVSLRPDDARVIRYLRGETIELSEEESAGCRSWTLFSVDGFPLGWTKWAGGGLRNKYYAGWRIN